MTARNITQQPECHTFNGAAPNGMSTIRRNDSHPRAGHMPALRMWWMGFTTVSFGS